MKADELPQKPEQGGLTWMRMGSHLGYFYLANSSQLDLAKHFFELGLKAQQKGG